MPVTNENDGDPEVPSGIYIARLTTRPARPELGRRTGQARLVTPGYTKSIKVVLLK